jgi:hypothetical protein
MKKTRGLHAKSMLLAGEIFVPPMPHTTQLAKKMNALQYQAVDYHWRIYDVVATAVTIDQKLGNHLTNGNQTDQNIFIHRNKNKKTEV